MMYKYLTGFLLFCCLQVSGAVVIRQVDPLLKVLPGAALPAAFTYVQSVAIRDYVSFQLILLPDADADVQMQFSSPTISSSLLKEIKQYKVDDVKVNDNLMQRGSDYLASSSRMYPDPLIPQTVFTLKKNKPITIFLDLFIDARIPAAIHEVTMKASSKGIVKGSTVLKFQVFKVAVPAKKLNYVNWYHDVKYELMNGGKPVADFSPQYWKIFKNTVQQAKDLGQNCFAINPLFLTRFTKTKNNFGYDFTNLNKAVSIILNELKMDYVVARQFGSRTEGWESSFGLQVPYFYGDNQYMMKVENRKIDRLLIFTPAF